MPDQNFKNHTKWDPPFHFFLAPVLVATFLFTIKHALDYPNSMTVWLCVLALALIVWLMRTRLYTLRVQDRLIQIEERIRFERLAAPDVFERLTPKQIIALRFASDGEVTGLARRALDEGLTPLQIKQAIQQWRPDRFRV